MTMAESSLRALTPKHVRAARALLAWSQLDLAKCADRTDGAVSMPTLLVHLIRATHRPSPQLRFPADESVRYAGWDGQTLTEAKSEYVPEKGAGWEIGAQRSKIANKATEDYQKR